MRLFRWVYTCMHQLFPHAIVQFLAYDMWKMHLIVEMRGAHREICGRIVRIWCRKNESSWTTLLNQSQAHLKRDGMNTYVSLGWVNGLMSPATLWLTITQVWTSDWTLAWLTWNNHRDHRRMEMNDLTGKISIVSGRVSRVCSNNAGIGNSTIWCFLIFSHYKHHPG